MKDNQSALKMQDFGFNSECRDIKTHWQTDFYNACWQGYKHNMVFTACKLKYTELVPDTTVLLVED